MTLEKPSHVVEAGQAVASPIAFSDFGVYFLITLAFFGATHFIAFHYLYRRLKRLRPDLWRRVFGYDGKNPDILPQRKVYERVMWSSWRDTTALLEAQDDERVKYAFAVYKCSLVFYFVAFFLAFFSPFAGPIVGELLGSR